MSGFDGGLHEAWAQHSRYGGMPAVVALESEEEKRSRLTSFLKDTCVADVAGYCKQPATKSRRLCNYHIRNVALGLFTSGPWVISR